MKTTVSAPPPAPAPVDPGQASLDFINKMADPALQAKLLGAEQQFRPEYTKLNLAEQQQYMFGTPDQMGAIGMLQKSIPGLTQAQEDADRLKRDADIRALQSQSEGYLGALMKANPQMFAQLEAAREMGGKTDFFGGLQQAITGAQKFGDVTVTPAQATTTTGAAPVNLQGYQATTGQAALQKEAAPVTLGGFNAATGTATMAGPAPTATSQGYTAAQAAAPMLGAAPTVTGQGYTAQQGAAALLGAAPTITSQGYTAAQAGPVADVNATNIQQGNLGAQLYGQAMQAAPTTTSAILQQRAREMAQSTGQLTPEELRNVQQSTREAFAARGMEMGNAAIGAEAMARAGATRERQMQDIQQATALNQAYLADVASGRQFAADIYGRDIGLQQANQGAGLQAALANQGMAGQLSLANQAAMNQALQFGAGAANQAGLNQAQLAAQYAMANQGAQNEMTALNMAAANQAGQFGASAQNAAAMANAEQAARFALANQGTQAQANLANAAAMNQAGQFGAGAANQASLANMQMLGQYGLSNQQAANAMTLANMQNQQGAAQFGASAANQAALANQQAYLQQAAQNQAAMNQFGLANMDAYNQAAQFGAAAGNQGALTNQQIAQQAMLANQAAQNQYGLFNAEQAMNAAFQNQAFQAAQQQQNIANLGLLGQAQQNQLAANRAYQQQLVGMYGAAFDPMATVLGRPSGALGVGQNQQGMAAGLMQAMGGQVFDPNAGINLALQNAANLGNYQAATYGAQAGAQGAIAGGMMQGLGALGGGLLGGAGAAGGFSKLFSCWVAREVYGEGNPRWLMFREWLMVKGPSWFRKLYNKYGEGFAKWISNKPRIKNLIRKWMDARINNYLKNS